jgi:hypothetical protein
MAPIEPSTMLVCWSSSTASMPISASSEDAQDNRTGSFVRISSFIGARLETLG